MQCIPSLEKSPNLLNIFPLLSFIFSTLATFLNKIFLEFIQLIRQSQAVEVLLTAVSVLLKGNHSMSRFLLLQGLAVASSQSRILTASNFLLTSFRVDCHFIKSRGSRSLSLQNQKKSKSAPLLRIASRQYQRPTTQRERYESLIHSHESCEDTAFFRAYNLTNICFANIQMLFPKELKKRMFCCNGENLSFLFSTSSLCLLLLLTFDYLGFFSATHLLIIAFFRFSISCFNVFSAAFSLLQVHKTRNSSVFNY